MWIKSSYLSTNLLGTGCINTITPLDAYIPRSTSSTGASLTNGSIHIPRFPYNSTTYSTTATSAAVALATVTDPVMDQKNLETQVHTYIYQHFEILSNHLALLLQHLNFAPSCTEAQNILTTLYKQNIILILIKVLENYSYDLSIKSIATIFALILELVNRSNKFTLQFTDQKGLRALDFVIIQAQKQYTNTYIHASTNTNNNTHATKTNNVTNILLSQSVQLTTQKYLSEAIVSLIQISSHLARMSDDHYESLSYVFSTQKLSFYLLHNNPIIRAKCCNLIGNLCRHSDKFYSILAEPFYLDSNSIIDITNNTNTNNIDIISLININPQYSNNNKNPSTSTNHSNNNNKIQTTCASLLALCCADTDSSTRKFACFAIGNAAFYSNRLYPYLKICISYLHISLDDVDDKTRANAAGAIGNLVRNSQELEIDIAHVQLPEKLLNMALIDRIPSAQRIALFALGSLCVYTYCKQAILQCENPKVLDVIKIINDISNDEGTLKFIIRLKSKLEANTII